MNRQADPSPSAKIYLALNAAALLGAGTLMILVARGGGFSRLRMLLIGATFLLAVVVAAAAILLQIRPENGEALHLAILSSRVASRLGTPFGILFLVFWCLMWFPPEYTGRFYSYFIGLYPLILCGTFGSGSAVLYMIAARDAFAPTSLRQHLLQHRTILIVATLSLLGFALVALLIRTLRVLQAPEEFWQAAGVPLLAWQVILALIIAVLALNLEARIPRWRINSASALFLLIWAVTAILWARQPVGPSYWVTRPLPPNREYYPVLDMETFDLGSQFALIGQGINNRVFWDRALYMSFLVYLHSVGGQNYQQLMTIQAAIFAIFPALLYVVGRKLHSGNAGIILATLTALRGVNSLLAVNWIHSSTFKHMLTEFPTGVGLAIFVLLVLKWSEAPQQHWRHALWAAGVLGLTSLLRPHVLLLVPLLVIAVAWLYRIHWKSSLLVGGATVLAFLASISPWIFLGSGANSIFAFYGQRVHDVMQQRYAGATAPLPTESPGPISILPSPTESPGPIQPSPFPEPGVPFQAAHFLHNLVTTALIFPDSPEFLSLRPTIQGKETFWQFRWDGHMSPTATGMLIVNLAVIALGMGAAYQHVRWRGMMPLAVFLTYHAANAWARTSGGRYLVPVDWILVCYFGLGLAELLRMANLLARQPSANPDLAAYTPRAQARRFSAIGSLSTLALLGMIGGLVPLAGVLYPLRYSAEEASAVVNRMKPYFSNLNLTAAEVNYFLGQPGAVVLYGRALYPRFYARGASDPFSYGPVLEVNYPSTVFALIGPHGLVFAVLPGKEPTVFPDASDAILLGCRSTEQGYEEVSALAVVLPEQNAGYVRSPAAPLICPLREPVCDNNGNCR